MDSHGGPRTRGREPQPEGGSGVKGRLPGWRVWRSHWGGGVCGLGTPQPLGTRPGARGRPWDPNSEPALDLQSVLGSAPGAGSFSSLTRPEWLVAPSRPHFRGPTELQEESRAV